MKFLERFKKPRICCDGTMKRLVFCWLPTRRYRVVGGLWSAEAGYLPGTLIAGKLTWLRWVVLTDNLWRGWIYIEDDE